MASSGGASPFPTYNTGGLNTQKGTTRGGPGLIRPPAPARLPTVRAAPHVNAPRAPKPVKPVKPKPVKPKAAPKVKAPAPLPGSPYALANNALTHPDQTLTGTALAQAAQALADAQTKGPLAELAAQIALNQRQSAAAQKNTAGYFNQLGQYVNQSNQQLGGLAGELNTQLAGIGDQTQGTIGQAFQPGAGLQNLASSGLGTGAMGSLDAERAAQQGIAGQDAQAFRSAGALQGNNYRSLGASNLGTYALRGQETLGKIGQAGELANEPLNQKIAGLQASRGALYSTGLGRLRQQELTNEFTKAGLGINAAKVQASVQNNLANQKIKNRGLSITQQHNRAVERIAQINSRIARGNLSERQRHDLITERTGLINATTGQGRLSETQRHNRTTEQNGGGRGGVPAGQRLRSRQQGIQALNSAYSTVNQLKGMKLSNGQIRQVLTQGYLDATRGTETYRKPDGSYGTRPHPVRLKFSKPPGLGNGPIANAALDLWIYHYLSPSDVRALRSIGFDPTGAFRTTPPSRAAQGVGGAATTIAGGTRSLNPF